MEDEIVKLKQMLKGKQKLDIIQNEVLIFIQFFSDQMKNESKSSFFSFKLFKASPFDQGIQTMRECIYHGVFTLMPYELTRRLRELFGVLMKPSSSPQIHKESFTLFLEILYSSSSRINFDDIEFVADFLVDACCLRRFSNNSEELIYHKEKGESFIYDLFAQLISFMNQHPNPLFWWAVMCYSIIPPLISSPQSKTVLSTIPIFPYVDVFQMIIGELRADSESEILTRFPQHLLRICYDISHNNPALIFTFVEVIGSVQSIVSLLSHSSDNDCQSVTCFFESILFSFGTVLSNPQNYDKEKYLTARTHFTTCIKAWTEFTRTAKDFDRVSEIVNQISIWVLHFPDPFSLFGILLMIYLTGLPIPSQLRDSFSQVDSRMLSSACAFACIIAIAFAHQLIGIDSSITNHIFGESFSHDCVSVFISLNHSPLVRRYTANAETNEMIKGVHIMGDKRPVSDAIKYIEMLFNGWESDSGMCKLRACFTYTLITLISSIPLTFDVSVSNIFSDSLLKFHGISDGADKPELVILCTEVVVGIISLRSFSLSLPSSLVAKTTLMILKSMCFSNYNLSSIAADRACHVILSGNSVFFTIIPFLLYYFWNYPNFIPEKIHIQTVFSASQFFSRHPCKKSVQAVEGRVSQLIKCSQDSISDISKRYFIMHEKKPLDNVTDPGFPLFADDTFAEASQRMLLCWMRRYLSLNNDVLNYQLYFSVFLSSIGHVTYGNCSELDIATACEIAARINPQHAAVLQPMADYASKFGKGYVEGVCSALMESFFLSENIKKAIPALFLAIDVCTVTKNIDTLKYIFNRITQACERNPVSSGYYDIANLLLLTIARMFDSSYFSQQKLTLEPSSVLSFSSNSSIHIVQDLCEEPVVISTTLSGKSIFKIKKNTIKYSEPLSIKMEPTYEELETPEDGKIGSIICEFDFYTRLRDEVIQAGYDSLLASPKDIQSCKPVQDEITPISPESNNIDSLSSGSGVSYPALDETLSALCVFRLFGGSIAEIPIPQKCPYSNDILYLLQNRMKNSIFVPVFYSLSEQISVKDSLDTQWENTSELFKQFVLSLGMVQNNRSSIVYSKWNCDCTFEIAPLVFGTVLSDSWIASALKRRIQIIWNESTELDKKDYISNGIDVVRITIQPLRNGLLRIVVDENFIKSIYGPLSGIMLVPYECLPSLIQTSVISIYSAIALKEYIDPIEQRTESQERMNRIISGIQ